MFQHQIPEPDIKSDDFVGRDELMEIIHKAINDWEKLRIINIQGTGGIGKTSVLRELKKRYSDDKYKKVFITNIIDFFDIAVRSRRGFMLELFRELKQDNEQIFDSAAKAWNSFTELELAGVTGKILEDKRKKVAESFDSGYKQMASDKRIVILVDTFEVVQHILGDWLAEFLQHRENTVAVIAGRNNSEWQNTLNDTIENSVIYYELKEFEEQDTEKLFELSEAGRQLDKEECQKLQVLSNGLPILLTLALDWQDRKQVPLDSLTNTSAKYLLEDLKAKSEDELKTICKEFESELVLRFMEFKPHDNAINLMAIVYKFFTPEMLNFFLDMPVDEAHELLFEISSWTFLKYNKRLNNYQLHDLIRDMLVEHVWPQIDPSGKHRNKIYQNAVKYYDNLIAGIEKKEEQQRKIKKQAETKGDDVKERDAVNHLSRLKKERLQFQIQKTYYDLMADYDNAIIRYSFLFVNLVWAREREFYDLIREERKNACKMLGKEYPEEQILLEEARIKIVAQGKFDQGLSILNNEPLADIRKSENPHLYSDILLYRGIAHNYRGESEQSEKFLNGTIDILKDLEKNITTPFGSEDLETLRISRGLGRAYTNLGYLYYSTLRLSEADTAYKEALRHTAIAKMSDIKAAVQNDLAFVYARLGHCEIARGLCVKGLKVREDLLIEYYIGLSYSMLGRIEYFDRKYERGEKHCRKALAIFRRIGDQRGLALAHRALGGNLTGIGLDLEDTDKFEEAEKHLIAAKNIFTEKGREPEPVYLIEIYEYLALLYQDWGILLRKSDSDGYMSYFNKAEECFKLSVQQAKTKDYQWAEMHLTERLFSLYFKDIKDMEKAGNTLKQVGKVLSEKIPEHFDLPAEKRGVSIDKIEIRQREYIYLFGRMLRGKGRISFADYLEKKEPSLLKKSAEYYTRACAYIEFFSPDAFGMTITLKEVVDSIFEKITMQDISTFRDQVVKTMDDYGLKEYQKLKQWIDNSTGLI
ncbi:MAG: ATP-binding protein [Desulfobacterales bacterium]|nr:ATP-binding protein [Desulfobacterales bacterium]